MSFDKLGVVNSPVNPTQFNVSTVDGPIGMIAQNVLMRPMLIWSIFSHRLARAFIEQVVDRPYR